jgi:hypothetical protein
MIHRPHRRVGPYLPLPLVVIRFAESKHILSSTIAVLRESPLATRLRTLAATHATL